MKDHHLLWAKWVLVAGGLITAWEALGGISPVYMLGSLGRLVDILVFGGAAVMVGLHLYKKHKK